MKPQIVIDTNVLFSALRSQLGASHHLLLLVDSGKFEVNLSVPLVLEYEEVLKSAAGARIALSIVEVDDILDYLCRVANLKVVSYLWRPLLSDPDDDMVLELAVAAGCADIVTYNKGDFAAAKGLGVRLLTPREFLREIGELP
jgi:putative PIN family toxin of toxin-antitoxin system